MKAITASRPVSFLMIGISICCCLSPWGSAPIALFLGVLIAFFFSNPFESLSAKLSKQLLQYSVVGLGFGQNLFVALKAGQSGFVMILVSVVLTLLSGILLAKWLKVDFKVGYLISAGTAICGGSAIAATGPCIDAKKEQMSIALGTVFILNAIALFVFPYIGHLFSLSQQQFGTWSAIAIHDTSAVVGAASIYGEEALKVATTVKLARALWIIPVAFISTFIVKGNKESNRKVSIPYFIFFFVIAMLVSTFFPSIHIVSPLIVMIAKKGLVVSLFLIGLGLSPKVVGETGWKPILMGVVLWVTVSALSLVGVMI
ncbi:putative sulfate exporter family transporter [Limibacter armeniacum]|uniref:YeiH family protein n=1 Tax=Limibacter armeniacum TaxID=466084 RepID=UPI002FE58F52